MATPGDHNNINNNARILLGDYAHQSGLRHFTSIVRPTKGVEI